MSSGLITILRVLAVPTLKSAPESYKPRPAPFWDGEEIWVKLRAETPIEIA